MRTDTALRLNPSPANGAQVAARTTPINRTRAEMMQKTVLRLEAMHTLITAGAGKHDRNIV